MINSFNKLIELETGTISRILSMVDYMLNGTLFTLVIPGLRKKLKHM